VTLQPECTVGPVTLRGITPENRKATLDLAVADIDAIRDACRFAFDDLGLHRVQAWLVADDPAVATYEAVGFTNEGRARDRVWRDGRFHDCVLLGLLHGELT
jgi:hypothetical protein